MGFFKSISKNLGPIGGAVAGGFLAPAGFGLAGAALGFGLGGQLFGDDPQVEALRRAGKIEDAASLRAEKQQAFILEQTAPFREAGRDALGQLQAEVQAPIGESPLFQRGLQAGTTGLAGRLSALGLGDSSTAGLAFGELTAGLSANEIQRRQGILSGLAGFGEAGLGTGLGALQLQSGLSARQAQTAAGIGGAQAAGQQALTGNLFQLGLLGLLPQQQTVPTLGGSRGQATNFPSPFSPTNINLPFGGTR